MSRTGLRRHWKAVAATAVLLTAVAIGALSVLLFGDWPGGMRPSYPARDGDPRLTRDARAAVPIIAALDQSHARHGRYPPDLPAVAPLLPAGAENPAGQDVNVAGWSYAPTPLRDGYVLSLRSGWDPSLRYRCDGPTRSWTFDPGDGGPERPLLLDP